MNVVVWIIIAIFAITIYPLQLYIRTRINKKKIKLALNKIHVQVDLKHSLLKQYIEINKDTIDEDKYLEIEGKLANYMANGCGDVNMLKKFNEVYSSYLFSFDDSLLQRKCRESEEMIKNIKVYYNNMVVDYNKYKSNKVNKILSKALFIDDEITF